MLGPAIILAAIAGWAALDAPIEFCSAFALLGALVTFYETQKQTRHEE
jgi:hypothetical protein